MLHSPRARALGSDDFRGRRIFPAVFIGVAIGLLANRLVDDVPIALVGQGGGRDA